VLTWLAVAGNPMFAPPPPRHSLAAISLADLSLQAKLGEGTSGLVHRALWRGETVAVKMYKQKLSSDGRNIDEVAASSAVEHEHVVKLLGYFEEPSLGAVLEWTDGYTALGGPPSFESITRDTYPEGTAFAKAFVERAACGIAAAAAHLHARSMCHGDLYAHNILVRPSGDAKLGDFGAAFYYADSPHAERFQQMEVRSFGHLLEELVVRLGAEDASSSSDWVARMTELSRACTGPAARRPSFQQLAARLALGPNGSCSYA